MPPAGSQPATRILAPLARTLYRARRVAATVVAILLALVFGWHAFFGQNGITAYAQKRAEERQVQQKIEQVSKENAVLSDKVSHLQSDPDTIEMEARRRLHYTRPGEVIYTMGPPAAEPEPIPAAESHERRRR